MLETLRDWFGFGGTEKPRHHHEDGHGAHGHTHGTVDPGLASTAEGLWAVKWSFAILAVTALLQLSVVYISGSVALFADAIHNVGDASTAMPLGVAFLLARRKPSRTFTYGLGRVEDLAGLMIVLIILFSALFAGYEAINRFFHPQDVTQLAWLAAAGIIGFAGNEVVAVFRIRTGRRINSAALIADGYHARTDGLTSLAVVAGAIGVGMGFPLADPIIGLLITIAILGIVWQSARAVFTRMLDGIDPAVIEEIHHATGHVAGVMAVKNVKARWLGHELLVELDISVDAALSITDANRIATAVKDELFEHLPALKSANVAFAT